MVGGRAREGREGERERDRERQRERETDRHRQTERDREAWLTPAFQLLWSQASSSKSIWSLRALECTSR